MQIQTKQQIAVRPALFKRIGHQHVNKRRRLHIGQVMVNQPLRAGKFRRGNEPVRHLSKASGFTLAVKLEKVSPIIESKIAVFKATDCGVNDERLLNKIDHLCTHDKTREFRRIDDFH